MSYFRLQLEETPRYEGAPATAPYRVSTAAFDFPLIGGNLAHNPEHLDRSNEMRGRLAPPPGTIQRFGPSGSVRIPAILTQIVPLLVLAGHDVTITEGAGTNEIQTLSLTGDPTGGSFTLTYDSETTEPIAYNATAAQVQRALERIPTIGRGNVVCAGGPLDTDITITFVGALAATDVDAITTTDSLTGGTTPSTSIAETEAGVAGAVTDPDGNGITAGAYKAVFTKRTSATPRAAQVTIGRTPHAVFERGQGFAVTQLTLPGGGESSAELIGLYSRDIADPGITPSHDAMSVHPLLDRDLITTWRTGAGNISGFTGQIASPVEAIPNYGIRSAYPGVLRRTDYPKLSGSVNMDAYDLDDLHALLEADTFAASGHWRSLSKIGSTGFPYSMWVEMPACQVSGGQGAEELAAKEHFGAAYEWMATDDGSNPDYTITVVSGVSAVESYS